MPRFMEHDGTKEGEDKYHVNINNRRYYSEPELTKNIKQVQNLVRHDWDAVYVCDGEVGAGKSCFIQQAAYLCSDGKITYSATCFTPQQFKTAIVNSPRYGAVIFDEAFRGLSSRSAMSQTNQAIVSMLQEIRQRNLFVFILLPSIWDLDSYVSKHRTRGLFHVHTDEKKKRGYFRFYNKAQVLDVLKDPKNKYKYRAKYSFRGKFNEYYPIEGNVGGEEYKQIKWDSLKVYEKERSDEATEKQTLTATKWRDRALVLAKKYIDSKLLTYTSLEKIWNIDRKWISTIISRQNKDENVENEPHSEGLGVKFGHNMVLKGIKKEELPLLEVNNG